MNVSVSLSYIFLSAFLSVIFLSFIFLSCIFQSSIFQSSIFQSYIFLSAFLSVIFPQVQLSEAHELWTRRNRKLSAKINLRRSFIFMNTKASV